MPILYFSCLQVFVSLKNKRKVKFTNEIYLIDLKKKHHESFLIKTKAVGSASYLGNYRSCYYNGLRVIVTLFVVIRHSIEALQQRIPRQVPCVITLKHGIKNIDLRICSCLIILKTKTIKRKTRLGYVCVCIYFLDFYIERSICCLVLMFEVAHESFVKYSCYFKIS